MKPQAAASAGSLNQKPTLKVFTGGTPRLASKPKIWSSRIVLIVTWPLPSWLVCRSDWYQAKPKFPPKFGLAEPSAQLRGLLDGEQVEVEVRLEVADVRARAGRSASPV